MNYYEIRRNTGWNRNIRGLWVIVENGWRAHTSYETKKKATEYLTLLRGENDKI